MSDEFVSKELLQSLYEKYATSGTLTPGDPCPWCLETAYPNIIPPIGLASLWILCDAHHADAMEQLHIANVIDP